MPDSTLSTLENIRTKIRRITRSPSGAQISDDNIDKYINNFVLYDFPQQIRINALKTVLTFFTSPYIDVYETNALANDPLFNFKNEYIFIEPPVFIAGYNAYFSRDRAQFFNTYPNINRVENIGLGDGANRAFAGTLTNLPVVRGQVMFSSIDAGNNALILADDSNGNLVEPSTGNIYGGIGYVDGIYNFTFPVAPALNIAVNAQTFSYTPSRPFAVLYYHEKFTLRPIPDQAYRVEVNAYRRPTELLNDNDMPYLSQFWQYIAIGAAKKIFEDRLDTESIRALLPQFDEQEQLVLKRTILEFSDQRAATIYSEINTPRNIFGFPFNNF
jgi:hypothetical protein